MKYLEILNQTADDTAAANNVLTNEEANLALQSAILATKRAISAHEITYNNALRVRKVDFNTICDVKDEISLLVRKLNQLEELKNELF